GDQEEAPEARDPRGRAPSRPSSQFPRSASGHVRPPGTDPRPGAGGSTIREDTVSMKLRKLGIIGAAGALAVSAAVPTFAQAPEDPLGVIAIPAGEPLHVAFWGVLSGPDSSLG